MFTSFWLFTRAQWDGIFDAPCILVDQFS